MRRLSLIAALLSFASQSFAQDAAVPEHEGVEGDEAPGDGASPEEEPGSAEEAPSPSPEDVEQSSEAAEQIARRDLIAEAEIARNGGDHEHALQLAARASEIRMSPSLQLFIAQEQALTDRAVSALAGARDCARQAELDPGLANRQVILRTCQELVEEVLTRVVMLTVHVPDDDAQSAEVEVNGQPLRAALFGVPYALAPGSIVVTARAHGRAFRRELELDAGAREEVEVELAGAPEVPGQTPARASSSPGLSPVIFGVMAGTTAALGAAMTATAVLTLDAADRFADQSEICWAGDAHACTEAAASRAEASDLQTATNALIIATAFAGAASLGLVFLTDFGGQEVEVQAGVGRLSVRVPF